GHNDVFVGLALLGAVVLVARRPALAGAVLGAAVLVKATAVLALAGLAAWLLYRRHRAGAALFAGAAALVVLVGGALGGGASMLLGAYVLPWYAVWVLPTLVARTRRRLALAVVVLAALFQMAELPGRRGPGGAPVPVTPWLHHLQSGALYLAVPVVEAAVAAALIGAAVAAARRSSPSRPGPDPAARGRVFSQATG